MITTHQVIKDGNNFRYLKHVIDESKPTLWVDGHQYFFNKTLIKSALVTPKQLDKL